LIYFSSLILLYVPGTVPTVGSGIRDENFQNPDPGSGMKNLGIRIRNKTSRIHSTDCTIPIKKVQLLVRFLLHCYRCSGLFIYQESIFLTVLWIRIRMFWLDPNPNPKKKFGFGYGLGFPHCCRMKIFVKNQKSNT
jgi:hypothetical protein